jgi:hypothetical protein
MDTLRAQINLYRWNRKVYHLLNKENFWQQENKDLSEEEKQWQSIGPYAYYASNHLREVSEYVLSISVYCKKALKESARYQRRYRRKINRALKAFDNYLKELNKTVATKHQILSQVMLARLKLAAEYCDIAFDDVVYDITKKLNKKEVDLSSTVGKRPKAALQRRLSAKEFYYFHDYIMSYGSKELKEQCKKLPWVKQGWFQYNEKKRR